MSSVEFTRRDGFFLEKIKKLPFASVLWQIERIFENGSNSRVLE